MRKLLLLRGPQGSLKTTWVRENSLADYVIEQDAVRLMVSAPVYNEKGLPRINGKADFLVVNLCMELLEGRMRTGCFTVFDACNIIDLGKFRKLAEKYRYQVYYKNFEAPLDVLYQRNSQRGFRDVDHEVVHRTWNKFNENLAVGPWCSPIETLDDLAYHPEDLSAYKAIHHVGDLQGCYSVLKEAYETIGKPEDHPENLYVFVGDLVDRGIENAAVVEEFMRIVSLPNVIFLEGNHERWLFNYVDGMPSKSKEFSDLTAPQLDDAGINKHFLRDSLGKLRDVLCYTYGDKRVLVTHAGLHAIEPNLHLISSSGFIHGYGGYDCDIDALFISNCASNEYQVHGHRNSQQHGTQMGNSFNLEGRVEFQGGYLRVATLDQQGWKVLEVENHVYKNGSTPREFNEPRNEVMALVKSMRASSLVKEKTFDHVSSFSFTRDAWNNRQWNDMTVKARGFFVDCKAGAVVTRSYDKFFNVGEVIATSGEALLNNVQYPVAVYGKENGFLGLVGWDVTNSKLFVSSKSVTGHIYDGYLNELLERFHVDKEKMAEIASAGYCFAFEVIHNSDPHIIDYLGRESLVLLDVFKRDLAEERRPYKDLQRIALDIGTPVKELCHTFQTKEELREFLLASSTSDHTSEGYVLEGANGFKTKIKLPYYNYWKSIRSRYGALNNGVSYERMITKATEEQRSFLLYCSKQYESGAYPSLIEARRSYYASR